MIHVGGPTSTVRSSIVNVAQTQSPTRGDSDRNRQYIELPGGAAGKRILVDFSETFDDHPEMMLGSLESPPAEATVLVVDDDRNVLDIVQELLMSVGYRVIRATSGRAAYAIARRVHPALVLSDRNMPDGDGDELLRRLRSSTSTSNIPVVLMSSCDPEYELPADVAFLLKPFDLDYLLRTIRERVRSPRRAHG